MYKIVNVFVQNVKKIKMVDITPTGNIVILEGKNAQGKTSILDAIEFALTGKTSLPPKPVRDGADKAKSRVDIGEYIIERTWNEAGNTYLKIEAKETGVAVKSPQMFLDEIIGRLSFDSFKFVSMSAAERVAEIKAVAGIDFTALENKYNAAYGQRTDLNRDLTKLKGELAAYSALEELKPTRDVAEIQKALDDAAATNFKILEWKSQKKAVEAEIHSHKITIVEIESQIKALEERKIKGINLINLATTKLQGLDTNINMMAEIDTTDLKAELNTAQQQAGLKFKHERRTEIKTQISKTEKDIMVKENEMDNTKQEKAEMLRSAKMPIEGLAIGKDDIYFNEQPFIQISDAQKIKVSLSIAAAKNSKLKFVQIRNGSLLDSESFAEIKAFAETKDIQVWIERVANESSGDSSAVFIEDGGVKE